MQNHVEFYLDYITFALKNTAAAK